MDKFRKNVVEHHCINCDLGSVVKLHVNPPPPSLVNTSQQNVYLPKGCHYVIFRGPHYQSIFGNYIEKDDYQCEAINNYIEPI